MRIGNRKNLAIMILFLFVPVFLLSGLSAIPFHPDETSVLYQSRDLELYLTNPALLFWNASSTSEKDQTYRLLNPPLPKYILGLSRRIAGFGPEAVEVDWNWQQTWNENRESGALPDRDLLNAGRVISASFLLLALIPLSLTARRLGGKSLVALVIVLFATHALLLLHGRRAMSEGVLIFGVSLAIYGIIVADERPALAGIGAALAVSSKLSVAPLLLVGFVACIWRGSAATRNRNMLFRNIVIYSAAVVFVLLLLNPILWTNPVRVATEILNARIEFLDTQIETIGLVSPDQILDSPLQRAAAMFYHLFIIPPQTAEVANYIEATRPAVGAYLANPIHTFARNWLAGTIYFFLCMAGIVFSLLRSKGAYRRRIVLLLFATLLQALALLGANPFPFQRYYLPIVPFIILWIAIGLQDLLRNVKQAAQEFRRPAIRST